ncbi:MAG TPA: 3D domain-containing protein [bacterium]|nr:3D domain-containing protein [bacterium]
MILTCLLIGLVYPVYLAVDIWGLPFGRTVHIHADGRNLTFRSFRRTVGDAVESAQIPLQPGDRTLPDARTLLWPGVEIRVIRAVPVTLRLGQTTSPVRVAAASVGDALRVMGVTLGPIDRVYPRTTEAVYPGMHITVERRAWHTWIEQRPVAYSSRVVADPQVDIGNRIVRTPGRAGVDQRVIEALYANDRPAAMVVHQWTVAQPAAPEVIAVGTRAMIASRGDFAGHEYLMLEATAYYSGPNNFGGAIGPRTATGLLAQRGVVAVDPSVIPLGSRLFIDGYGYAVAGDTGGAIQGMRIDLCFNSYDEAIRFGRRTVKVYIIDRH